MSPLTCHTVHHALWERAASAGPAALSPVLADHLASCPACQAESREVSDLLAATRALTDPVPPAGLWDGFDEALRRELARDRSVIAIAWRRWGSRATKVAAVLAVGIGLGFAAARLTGPAATDQAAREREALLARLATDARIESALAGIEGRLAAGDPVPSGMVAGPMAPAAEQAARLERARVEREELRRLLTLVLAAELESEAHGFAYLDRRIAGIAGEHLLYLTP